MRIAHVVTLVSADGSFGGPLSVARGHITELSRRGHEVTLFAGWDGVARLDFPANVNSHFGRTYQFVPGMGFSGLVAPRLFSQIIQHVQKFDVVHIHLGRDPISNFAAVSALLRHIPYVIQTHGMVAPDARLRSRIVDKMITRRVLRRASSVLVLTETEKRTIEMVAPGSAVRDLPNGIELREFLSSHATGRPPDVLFCSRLHPRKRVLHFVEMAAILNTRKVSARFSVAGPDEGDLRLLLERARQLGISDQVNYEGAIAPRDVADRLRAADIFVLPSVNEPFGMVVLEALSVGTPTVITDSCHIAGDLGGRRAAIVTDGTPEGLADAVSRLLGDRSERENLRRNGYQAITETYNIGAVVDELERAYQDAVM